MFYYGLQGKTLTWLQTTSGDFQNNELNNLIVTNKVDGEVQLPPTLSKIQDDKKDMQLLRYTSTNASGEFIRTWIENENLYTRKYSKDSVAISDKLKVNNTAIAAMRSQEVYFRNAILDNGAFCVIWKDAYIDHNKIFKGQVFTKGNLKLEDSFEISAWASISIPTIYANNDENNFWVLYPDKEQVSDVLKEYVRKVSVNNEIDGEDFQLLPNRETEQFSTTIVKNKQNEYIISWIESPAHDNISNSMDLFICKFDSNLNLLSEPFKVNDDNKWEVQSTPYAVINESDELVLCWYDRRDGKGLIYAQLFNPYLEKIAHNFRVNDSGGGFPEIIYDKGEYKIIWSIYDNETESYLTKYNIWKFGIVLYGKMVSSACSVGQEGAKFLQFTSNGILEQSTELKFQIRSAETIDSLENKTWFGPNSIDDFYYLNDTNNINNIHENDGVIQYRALFHTEESGYSPLLHSVSIEYQPNDTTPPPLPENLKAEPGFSKVMISWDVVDEDVETIKIYRSHSMKLYSLLVVGTLSSKEFDFTDTTVVADEEYYYVLRCFDKSGNISELSEVLKAVPMTRKIYVGMNNGGNGDGTISSPYSSIKLAINRAHMKDTLYILPGEYYGNIELKENMTITGADVAGSKLFGSILAANNTVISNLSIISDGLYGIRCPREASVVIKDNYITSTIENNNPAISCKMEARPRIYRNYITNFFMGIHCSSTLPVHIKNNLIITKVGIDHSAYKLDRSSVIESNTIISGKPGWACLDLSNGKHLVLNNILVGDGEQSFGIEVNNVKSIGVRYNNLWKFKTYFRDFTAGEGNIIDDPKFISPEALNFDLSNESPGFNTGLPDDKYNDLDGTRNNMGAYGGQNPIKINPSDFLMKSISLDRLSAYSGDTVTCSLTIDNCSYVCETQFEISFNSDLLELLDVQLVSGYENVSMEYFVNNNGNLEIKTVGELIEINEPLVTIQFIVNSEAIGGESSPISFENGNLIDKNAEAIIIKSIIHGVFIVNKGNDSGNYIFVDGTNDNSGDGSQSNPFNQISTAMINATSGDTILVGAGEYGDKINLKNDVFLRGIGAKATSIKLRTSDGPIVIIKNVKKGEISGFRFVNDDSNNDGIMQIENSTIDINDNIFETSEMRNYLEGIEIGSNSNPNFINNYFCYTSLKIWGGNPVFKNNHFIQKIGNFAIFSCCQSSPTFFNNQIIGTCYINNSDSVKIINNKFSAEMVEDALYVNECDKIEILNNYFTSNFEEQGNGVSIKNSSDISICNNLFYKLKKGLYEYQSSAEVFNNIFYDNNSSAFQHSSETTLGYNAFYNNTLDYNNSSQGIDDVFENPLLTNPEKEQFQLQIGSPCKNAGNPDSRFYDLDGSRNDIGIYGGLHPYYSIQDNRTIIVGDTVNASVNDTIKMVFHGNSLEDIAKIGLNISFNENSLRLLKFNTTKITNGMALSVIEKANSYFQIDLDGVAGIKEESGELFEIEFLVTSNKSSNIEVAINNVKVENSFSQQIESIEINNGLIQINSTSLEDDIYYPVNYILEQNYPNPFNNETNIQFYLPKSEQVEVNIYDLLGKLVSRIEQGIFNQGYHTIKWDGKNINGESITSGVYFYQFKTKNYVKTKKLLYLK